MERRDVDVNKIVDLLTKMLGRLLGEDITLQLALDRGIGSIHADPGQIEQAVVNLAINARDAMPKGGVLTITTAVKTFDASTVRPPGLVPFRRSRRRLRKRFLRSNRHATSGAKPFST